MATNAVAVRDNSALVRSEQMEMSIDELCGQVFKLQQVMERVMKKDEHYGIIPGCKKPSLLKAGAEKLGFVFRLMPRFHGEEGKELGSGHREYVIKCELYHAVTGAFLGSGLGSCSTMEEKYRYRGGEKVSTGEQVPKDYWNVRKTDAKAAQDMIGGKGFTTVKLDGGWFIATVGEKIENPNLADTYNTVLKMAKKRAHVDAILTATAASDIFTQDIEEFAELIPAHDQGSTAVINQHLFKQSWNGIDLGPEDHSWEKGSHEYCPGCATLLSKESPEVQAKYKKAPPAVPPSPQELKPAGESAASPSSPAAATSNNISECISEAQAKRLFAISRSAGWNTEELKSYLQSVGVQHTREIKKGEQYKRICETIEGGTKMDQSAEIREDFI